MVLKKLFRAPAPLTLLIAILLILSAFGGGLGFLRPAANAAPRPPNLSADFLDGLDSTQFLRSDTSDNFTFGTLTFDAGTTLSIAGSLVLPSSSITGAGTGSGLDADLFDGQDGTYYLDLDNETGTCTNCLTGLEIDESTLVGVDADLLDGLDSTEFLRSNGSTPLEVPYVRAFADVRTAPIQTLSIGTTLIFNNEQVDTAGSYDPTTGIFTAPVAGHYRVHAEVLLLSTSVEAGRFYNVGVQVTGTGAYGNTGHYFQSSIPNDLSLFADGIVYLPAGGTAYVWMIDHNASSDPTLYAHGASHRYSFIEILYLGDIR